jgi:hypothetical protein
MHKLYILGALALANVRAYIDLGSGAAVANAITSAGKVTYTSTGDCFTTGTATSLGMNNIYYQYYSFTLAKGTAAYPTVTVGSSTTGTTVKYADNGLNACTHSHLYNWMA